MCWADPASSIFVEVVVDKYVDSSFDYIFPGSLPAPVTGGFVMVPFQGGVLTGCIVKIKTSSSLQPDRIKTVLEIISDVPPVSQELLRLAEWIAGYYGCPLGRVVRSMVPSFVFKNRRNKKNVISHLSKPVPVNYRLNRDQENALEKIYGAVTQKSKKVFMLWGVTGSGKTEVYMHAVRKALDCGGKALVIVPEIALTPQLTQAFRMRFCEPVAVFHSRLSDTERALSWKLAANGGTRIVLGARSAVFAPLAGLGIIVVDEEHERTYKQEESPRYNARDVAVVRGMIENVPVVLCSATPSLESYTNCLNGKYELIHLPSRVMEKPLPRISLVDMDRENQTRKGVFLFSGKLVSLMHERLKKKEQVILFMNRRGFTTCHVCSHCHHVMRCSECSITMTYHKADNLLVCHRCQKSLKPSRTCPECRTASLRAVGFGTEKIEKQASVLFPSAKIARLDSDTVKKKGTLEKVCGDFAARKIDILIGTQMIAKGLHFEGVTLVGVINGDLSMNIPDFRAGENTFQLITQVAGRAGRGENPGDVVVQAHCIRHPIFVYAAQNDYLSFYGFESAIRRDLNYPPFSHFILLTLSDRDENRAARTAHEIWASLRARRDFRPLRIFPAVPSPIAKVRSSYRFQILVSVKNARTELKTIQEIIAGNFSSRQRDISVDVDPYSMI